MQSDPAWQAVQQKMQYERTSLERLLAGLQTQDDTAVHALLRESPAAGDRVLARLNKSATEEIRLARSRYKGKEVVDIRVFFLDAATQTWKPSKKGLGFVVERWVEFREAVLQADQLLRQEGDMR